MLAGMKSILHGVSLAGLAVITAAIAPRVTAQTPDLYATNTIPEFRLTFQQSNWWTLLTNYKSSRTNISADLTVNGKLTLKNVGVRFRGNTSYSYNRRRSQKLPFNIDTDAFVPGQKLWGYSNLNLSNAYKDATFVREVVAYELMRKHVPALKAGWVRLIINNENWGVYVNIEQPGKGFLSDWYEDENGNLYRGDSPSRRTRPTLTYLGTNAATYASQYEYKTQGHPYPWVDLIKLTDILDRGSAATRRIDLPKVLNVDRALWYIALQTMFSNTDSYIGTGNDYLAYHDETHGRFQIMPWDLNTTFGGYDWSGLRLGAQGLKRMDPFYSGGTSLRRPLMTNLWAIPEWRERYLAHYRTMLDTWFDWSAIGPLVRKYHKLVEPYVRLDTKKLYTTQQFFDNVTKDVVVSDSYGSYTIPGLQSFIDTKRAFLLTHAAVNKTAPSVTALAHTPAQPTPKDVLTITAKISGAASATLHWRTRGAFTEQPMRDDGRSGDGAANDGVWGAQLPAQPSGTRIEYYTSAAATSSMTSPLTFAPRETTHALRSFRISYPRGNSAVRINEFVAKNTNGIKDQKGEFEDWVELGNTSNAAVDISDHYLTDDLSNPNKWKIPSRTSVPAKGTLLIWTDEDKFDGPLHANFKLSASGETIAFFAPDGKTLLDVIEFGTQVADVSSARFFDGKQGDDWVSLLEPSPRALNDAGNCGTRHYDAFDVRANMITLTLTGAPKIASTIPLRYERGVPNSAFATFLSANAAALSVDSRLAVMVSSPIVVLPVPSDAQGSATVSLPIPDDTKLVGARVYFQAFGMDAQGWFGSNAAEVTICPK